MLDYAIVVFDYRALSLSCCHPLALVRSPVFGTRCPGVSTVKLNRPLRAGYATVLGRLFLTFSCSVLVLMGFFPQLGLDVVVFFTSSDTRIYR